MRITDPEDMDDRSDDEVNESRKLDQNTGGVAQAVSVTPHTPQVKQDLNDLFDKLKK
jgi:hypothetical protein